MMKPFILLFSAIFSSIPIGLLVSWIALSYGTLWAFLTLITLCFGVIFLTIRAINAME